MRVSLARQLLMSMSPQVLMLIRINLNLVRVLHTETQLSASYEDCPVASSTIEDMSNEFDGEMDSSLIGNDTFMALKCKSLT